MEKKAASRYPLLLLQVLQLSIKCRVLDVLGKCHFLLRLTLGGIIHRIAEKGYDERYKRYNHRRKPDPECSVLRDIPDERLLLMIDSRSFLKIEDGIFRFA